MKAYGYNDPRLVNREAWTAKKVFSLICGILLIGGAWFFLNYKLLLGEDWISPTYDNEDWRTNEGNLHTNGVWDFETHIWKTEYIIENFPNFHWNPYWYLGMPLMKYYQYGFYLATAGVMFLTGFSAAKSGLYLVIFGHLLAVLLTCVVCYKVSGKIWASVFASMFLLASNFVTLRSYGWEPISIVFIFFYPLGLLFFLREPLRPFRLSLILTLSLAYLSHPLIFFALCMSFGLYLFSIAIREAPLNPQVRHRHYIWSYFALVAVSLLIGAVQFFPQISYEQQTSGAHMGVSYIPFYHVPSNIISPVDFFFSAGDLKGPGLVVMISFFLVIIFAFSKTKKGKKTLLGNELVAGFLLILAVMVLFYYLERYSIFPMNFLRSIQYHRIIPEFIVAAAVLISSLSNIIVTRNQKLVYYGMLLIFMLASGIVIFLVQTHWQTTESIAGEEEFIYEEFPGRISFPYPDQSLAVRNSFTKIPQVYGYYEQGVTNSFNDELFSVSSGFHSHDVSLIYLKAANVGRLYVNMEEGEPDADTMAAFNNTLGLNHKEGERYAYFEIPLANAEMAQAVSKTEAEIVRATAPQCRVLFKVEYCGSQKEEFVTKDKAETRYLRDYVRLLEKNNSAHANYTMINPHLYRVHVTNAEEDTAVILKMTHDKDFKAFVEGEEIPIYTIGPDFMIAYPNRSGNYTLVYEYNVSKTVIAGAIVSLITLCLVIIYFLFFNRKDREIFRFRRGDMR